MAPRNINPSLKHSLFQKGQRENNSTLRRVGVPAAMRESSGGTYWRCAGGEFSIIASKVSSGTDGWMDESGGDEGQIRIRLRGAISADGSGRPNDDDKFDVLFLSCVSEYRKAAAGSVHCVLVMPFSGFMLSLPTYDVCSGCSFPKCAKSVVSVWYTVKVWGSFARPKFDQLPAVTFRRRAIVICCFAYKRRT